jgi:hypothetical protein|tara:strand:+ start:441 stop:665 length:225 start_codon:yes stop_codon:yes gene_type:complete
MLKRRTSSTIPFGYVLSEDPLFLEEVPEQIKVLDEIKPLIKERALSLREGATWIEHKTGRRLSHAGLKKIVENG